MTDERKPAAQEGVFAESHPSRGRLAIERVALALDRADYDSGHIITSDNVKIMDARLLLDMARAAERLVADLAKFDADVSCEGCGAPLFDGDDFVTEPEGGCSGCWAAMTDLPSKRERPCYAYRVGKPSARDSGRLPKGEDSRSEAECEASQSGAAKTAHRPNPPPIANHNVRGAI